MQPLFILLFEENSMCPYNNIKAPAMACKNVHQRESENIEAQSWTLDGSTRQITSTGFASLILD